MRAAEIRITGDLTAWFAARSAGGLLNALALLAFVLSIGASVVRGSLAKRPERANRPTG